MKKFIIYLSIFVLVISTYFVGDQTAQAGAPKLIYETVEGTTKSMIKAIEARKGFKVIESTPPVTNNPPTATPDNVTSMIGKSLQEGAKGAAIDSWEVIKGGKFEKTPLKNMPGWAKVTLGTAAFLTSADIIFDIYEGFSNNPNGEFETIMPYSEALQFNPVSSGTSNSGMYRTTSIAGWEVNWTTSNGFSAVQMTIPNHGTFIVEGTYPQEQFNWTMPLYIQINEEGSAVNIMWEEGDPRFKRTYYIGQQWDYETNSGYKYFIGSQSVSLESFWLDGVRRKMIINPSHKGDISPVNHGVLVPVSAPQIEKYNVPEIDSTKQIQTLIIPEPSHFPDLDKAIRENQDMVSNPEEWLKNNPEHDPSPDGEKVPGEEGQPDTDSPTDKEIDEDITKKRKQQEDKSREWGNLITTKFPFSLPFDMYYLLSFLAAEPKAPLFVVDEDFNGMPFKFTIDLSFLDNYIGWFRTFIVLGFCFMLVMITRKLLGGAQ